MPKITENSVNDIKQHSDTAPDKPFFLYMALTSPHAPYILPDSIMGIRIDSGSDCGVYGDFVYLTDWAVGKIITTLDSLNLSDSTIVIFASDNGSHFQSGAKFNHKTHLNYKGQKADIYEAGQRIPLSIGWPGVVAPNTKCEETVYLVDIMTTLAAITRYELPENAGEDSDSLLPLLLNKQSGYLIREATVHQFQSPYIQIFLEERWLISLPK